MNQKTCEKGNKSLIFSFFWAMSSAGFTEEMYLLSWLTNLLGLVLITIKMVTRDYPSKIVKMK